MLEQLQQKQSLAIAGALMVQWQVDEVLAYQHPGLVERLEQKEHMSHEQAVLLFQDMLKFLALCGMKKQICPGMVMAPTEAIDIAWHHFILFTKDYAQFCHQFFGRFVHHSPATSWDVLPGNLTKETAILAQSIFGPLSSNWVYATTSDCSGSTNCQDVETDCANNN